MWRVRSAVDEYGAHTHEQVVCFLTVVDLSVELVVQRLLHGRERLDVVLHPVC